MYDLRRMHGLIQSFKISICCWNFCFTSNWARFFGFWPTICGNSTKKLILKKSNRQKTNDRMSVLACDPNQQGVSMIRVIIWRGILCQLINWAHFVISLIFWGGKFLSPKAVYVLSSIFLGCPQLCIFFAFFNEINFSNHFCVERIFYTNVIKS